MSEKKRPAWLKPVLFFVVIAVVAIAALIGLDFSLSHGLCQNTVAAETPSPNGRLKAVVFLRACGAAPNTQVSILGVNQSLPDRDGNVFATSGEPKLSVRWADDYHLIIAGRTRTDFQRLGEYKGIRITYE